MVTSMLEKAIEIEGLLRIIRDGNPLPETYILLNMKAAELAEQTMMLEEKASAPEPEPSHADFVMQSPSPTQAIPEVVFSTQESNPKETISSGDMEMPDINTSSDLQQGTEDLALIEEDDILLSFDDSTDPAVTEEPQQPETESETKPVEEGVVDFGVDNEAESDGKVEMEVEETVSENTDAEAPEPEEKKKRTVKLKSAFSLNDRFLYARELFDGNMKMFDSTLEFIEGIEDYSIIEDYFYSELEWNPENLHVAAFMDILRPHFKE